MNNTGLKKEHIERINRCFSRYRSIEKVILYGSRAKGTFKNSSDIDLAIIDHGLTSLEITQLENSLDDLLLPYKIDLSLKRHINNHELTDHIDRVGILFYTPNKLNIK